MQITVTKTMESLQEALLEHAREGRRIALVPTMGALHSGHAALVKHAKELADIVVVSIFVNPLQFGPNEDFSRYPRMFDSDVATAQAAGGSIIYAPDVEDLYPEGFSTSISAGALAGELCGKFRPGHFDGVATVVAKLLLRSLPHVAVFGEKDYQQLTIIRRVADDLDIPVEIVGMPTVRENDGLALSSRNLYLSEQERAIAPRLYAVMNAAAQEIKQQSAPVNAILSQAGEQLAASGFKLDYLELRDADTLAPLDYYASPARLLVAAWLGKTRLIDNIPLE
jgi:pantoate--beta-alanine ligase